MFTVKDQEVSEEKIFNALDIERYSSIEKAKRIAALVLRFVTNITSARKKECKSYKGRLTLEKLREAEKELIKGLQKQIPRDKKWTEMTRDLGLEESDGVNSMHWKNEKLRIV